MKNKLLNYLAMVSIIGIILLSVVVYMRVQTLNAETWRNKMLIAQVQPDIILAKSQAGINNAASFAVYTNSILVATFVWLPYLVILLYALVKLIPLGVELYAKTNVTPGA